MAAASAAGGYGRAVRHRVCSWRRGISVGRLGAQGVPRDLEYLMYPEKKVDCPISCCLYAFLRVPGQSG